MRELICIRPLSPQIGLFGSTYSEGGRGIRDSRTFKVLEVLGLLRLIGVLKL